MNIAEHEICFSDLGRLARSDALREKRRQGVCFVWTELPEFEATILNVFLPEGYVFGNFRVYEQLRYSERAFHSRYTNRHAAKETYKKLTAMIEASGNPKRSSFAAYALGSWTTVPDFGGGIADEPLPLGSLSLRHFSLLLPACDRDVVGRYFQQQLEVFGASALRPCSETFGGCSFDDLRDTTHWTLLCQPLMKLDEQAIRALDAEIGAYASNEAMSVLIAQLDPRYAVRGLVDLGGALRPELLDACHDAVSRILIFRAQIAARILDLYFLLAYRRAPGHFMGRGAYTRSLQEQLLELIETPLRPFENLVGFQFPSVSLA